MDLTPSYLKESMTSEVAKNKEFLSVGDKIFGYGYDYQIAEVSETYIQVIDESGSEDYLEFESMQLGWYLRNNAKRASEMVFRLPEGGWISYHEAITDYA